MLGDKPKTPVAAAFFMTKKQKSGQNGGAKVVEPGDKILDVHFNPATLQYTIANDSNAGRGKRTKQHVRHSSATLSMELIFDTTGSGEDVRLQTGKLAALVEAKPDRNNELPNIAFIWGLYTFTGIVKSYREVVDFFSVDGVPLRAMVSLTMDQGDVVLARQSPSGQSNAGPGEPQRVPTPQNQSATQTATMAGDPGQGRRIASLNLLESMRLPKTNSIFVSGAVQKSSPAVFAEDGADRPSGGVLGSFTGGSFASGPSAAGVPASQGAFSGLRAAGSPGFTPALDTSALLPESGSAPLYAGTDARFQMSGQADLDGAASLRADVGTGVRLSNRLRFDEG